MPRYQDIKQQMIEALRRGKWRHGQAIPSEPLLAKHSADLRASSHESLSSTFYELKCGGHPVRSSINGIHRIEAIESIGIVCAYVIDV